MDIVDLFTETASQLVNLRATHASAGRPEEAARVGRALGYLRQAQALAGAVEPEDLLDAEPRRYGTGEEE